MDRALQRIGLLLIGLVLLVPVSGCASRQKRNSVAGLDAETLYWRASDYLARRELRRARQSLEWIQFTAENRTTLEPLVRLALADIAFYQGDSLSLIDARSQYLDFVTLYTDHPRAPYAQLQAGVCSLMQANDPSRDQTETLQAISDLKEVLRRYPDSQYAKAAQDKINEAESQLAEHEFIVGRFYLKKGAYEAAASRFKLVVENYPRYPEKEKLYFYLARALILGNNDVEGGLYLDKLISDYPDSQWAGEARKLLPEFEGEPPPGAKGTGS